MQNLNDLTGTVVDAALYLHESIGPGLLESVYESLLAHQLEKRGLAVERQKSMSFHFDGICFENALRIDLLVAGQLIVELKSVETTMPVHKKQLLTYLRLLNMPVGLLINFGVPTLKHGIHRILNNRLDGVQGAETPATHQLDSSPTTLAPL